MTKLNAENLMLELKSYVDKYRHLWRGIPVLLSRDIWNVLDDAFFLAQGEWLVSAIDVKEDDYFLVVTLSVAESSPNTEVIFYNVEFSRDFHEITSVYRVEPKTYMSIRFARPLWDNDATGRMSDYYDTDEPVEEWFTRDT